MRFALAIFTMTLLSQPLWAGDWTFDYNSSPDLFEQMVSDAAAMNISDGATYDKVASHPTPEFRKLQLNLFSFAQTANLDYLTIHAQVHKREITRVASNHLFEQMLMELAASLFYAPVNEMRCRTALSTLQMFKLLDLSPGEIGFDTSANLYILIKIYMTTFGFVEGEDSCSDNSDRLSVMRAGGATFTMVHAEIPKMESVFRRTGVLLSPMVFGTARNIGGSQYAVLLSYNSRPGADHDEFSSKLSGLYLGADKLVKSDEEIMSKYRAHWQGVLP